MSCQLNARWQSCTFVQQIADSPTGSHACVRCWYNAHPSPMASASDVARAQSSGPPAAACCLAPELPLLLHCSGSAEPLSPHRLVQGLQHSCNGVSWCCTLQVLEESQEISESRDRVLTCQAAPCLVVKLAGAQKQMVACSILHFRCSRSGAPASAQAQAG